MNQIKVAVLHAVLEGSGLRQNVHADMRVETSGVHYVDGGLHQVPQVFQQGSQIENVSSRFQIHGARNVRVFGSVARAESGPGSDIDFLVAWADWTTRVPTRRSRSGSSLMDAVCRNLEIIGARNIRIHAYDLVEPDILEEVVERDLAVLQIQIENLLNQSPEPVE